MMKMSESNQGDWYCGFNSSILPFNEAKKEGDKVEDKGLYTGTIKVGEGVKVMNWTKTIDNEKILLKSEYVENEFKRWEDNYVIILTQEFLIKSMLGLQYEYFNTDDVGEQLKILNSVQRLLDDITVRRKTPITKE